ncbi:dihydrolipoyllysine-residue succinyltransferase component of 2-oxoglutarate dehydrogenase complex [Synergistales bacterium]|nr:dihydrolipoyllysine-residue succinyltransferase component of 2-oxoglutarate dehydrogenase complex [Synergistales bacterium]
MPAEIRMPQISMTMLDGTIAKWHKHEGDLIKEGEILLEIQTDKVVDVLNASLSGTLLKIIAQEGDVVPVGELLCLVEQDEKGAVEAPKRATPLAKKIARQKGIDLSAIQGTGPRGLIVKADLPNIVDTAPKQSSLSQEEPEDTLVAFEGIRRKIADNLMLSKRSAADVTTVADVDMGKIQEVRQVLPLSYTAFIIMASIKALKEYPIMNALVEDAHILIKKRIHIAVAVSTEHGLLTPVIRNADEKNVMTISEDLSDLAERGRNNSLTSQDFENGTFTVTNSGIYGSVLFTPIINHPQSAVLGIGRIAMTPVVRDEKIVAAPMMYLSLTYNHRSIDGETAVRFLQRIRYFLEHPREMMGGKK